LPRISQDRIEDLLAAMREQEYLARVLEQIETLHRVVFHGDQRVDWSRVRRSAEQVLIADIVLRHGGHAEGVYFALRDLEDTGKSWEAAIRELAASIHSYFTTPLGLVMRQDLYGEAAIFISPDGQCWQTPADGMPGAGQRGVT